MNINGVEFTPQEIEAVAIALDRMEEEQEELAAGPDQSDAEIAPHLNEAAVCRSARNKWSEVRREDQGNYVYDPAEDRCWGPFADEDDANRFIESDKYLTSWCAVQGRKNGTVYPPSAYHGTWPL